MAALPTKVGLISGLANRVSGGNLPDGSVNISG
jgi:hypothetical protein